MATSYCEVQLCRIPVPVIEREATTLPTPFRPGLPGLSDIVLCSQGPHTP